MKFVGASVDELLKHGDRPAGDDDIERAADALIESLRPIGEEFDLPWKFTESLELLDSWLPDDLRERLSTPGGSTPENHLEACLISLALEAGVRLEPLSKAEMLRLQHVAQHVTERDAWGRQSSYPWDTVAAADLDGYDFFALCART